MDINPTDTGSTKSGSLTSWSLKIDEKNCKDISIPFERMYNILHDKAGIIKILCSDFNLKAYFTVYMCLNKGSHALDCISNEILSFIASINAEIGFDLSCIY